MARNISRGYYPKQSHRAPLGKGLQGLPMSWGWGQPRGSISSLDLPRTLSADPKHWQGAVVSPVDGGTFFFPHLLSTLPSSQPGASGAPLVPAWCLGRGLVVLLSLLWGDPLGPSPCFCRLSLRTQPPVLVLGHALGLL